MFAALAGTFFGWLWRRIPRLMIWVPAQRVAMLAGWLAAFAYTLLSGAGIPAQRTLIMLSVATLGTLPILLWLFGQFSLASPLANALAIPIVGGLVAPLSVAAAFIPWTPLANFAHAVLTPVLDVLVLLAGQAWALWTQPAPPLWAVGIALVGLGGHLAAWRWRWRLLSALLVAPLFWPWVEHPPKGAAWVDVLDVGHGLAIVVRTQGHALQFDAGPRFGPGVDAGNRAVLPALRALGVRRLDGAVVSHAHSDHSGGVRSVQTAMPVGQWWSSLPEVHPLRQGMSAHAPCLAGVGWHWDGVDFRWLSPPPSYYAAREGGRKLAENRWSCVLRLDAGEGSVLIAADAERAEEAAMLANGLRSVDVLIVPHQGSRTSSTEAFVQALSPQAAVFSVGYLNRFGHPHPEVLARYQAVGSAVWRTDEQGSVHVSIGPKTGLFGWREKKRRYWDNW